MSLPSGRPLRLAICGQPFEVVWDDLSSKDKEGDEAEIDVTTQRVVMHSKVMAREHQRIILLHEVLHGIIGLTSQEDRFVEKGEEAVVDSMAVALLQVLHDNPHLVDWLVD